MNCNDVRPLLDLLCDGALDAKDSALVLDHLKSCFECQSEWDDMEQLHASFQLAKSRPEMPAWLMDKVSSRLREEDRNEQKKFFQSCMRSMPALAIAAAVVLVGFFVLPAVEKQNNQSPSESTASADTLVEDLVSAGTLEQVSDRSELTKRVGYDLKQVRLPQWHMERSGVYKSQAPVSIARFDFVRSGEAGSQRLSCYQAPQGVIRAKTADAVSFAGKQVQFGTHGKFQFALWSQNGRDYLFVTDLSKSQLQEIVAGA
jgi:anti-sigma factor RsiW